MNTHERYLVQFVARSSPWLAPLPSGYFVARASIVHLDLPLIMAIVVGAIIELLGITSVHTWLWLTDWNINKRKSDPESPAVFAVFLGVIYLIAAVGLTVVLEVAPYLALYAPANFPILAVIGAVNLALIAQQQQRKNALQRKRQERKRNFAYHPKIQTKPNLVAQDRSTKVFSNHSNQYSLNSTREQKKLNVMDKMVDTLVDTPQLSVSNLARLVGHSRTAIYKYLDEMEAAGRIRRNGNGIVVIQGYSSMTVNSE